MIIPIDENYRLMADEHCWHIQKARQRTKNGELVKTWESFKWFTTAEQAINALGNIMVRTSDAATLADALESIKDVTTTLSQALTPQFRVIQAINREGKV